MISEVKIKTSVPGKTVPVTDIVLGFAAGIALDASGPGDQMTMLWKWKSAGEEANATVARICRALIKKHLLAIDNKGNRVAVRKICRQLVLDILAKKNDVAPYKGIISRFVERNDKDFITGLGRGFNEGRKPVFDDIEWRLLLDWPKLEQLTDEQIASLFEVSLSKLRTKRQGLMLKH